MGICLNRIPLVVLKKYFDTKISNLTIDVDVYRNISPMLIGTSFLFIHRILW